MRDVTPRGTDSGPVRGGELVWALWNYPQILNPLFPRTFYEERVINAVFDGLVRANTRMEIEPWLARDVQISNGGRAYTVGFHPGITFHDGQPLTADDMAFTYNVILDPDYQGPFAGRFAGRFAELDSVTALDPHTVRFNLKELSAPFLSKLTKGIVPKHVYTGVPVANMASVPVSRALIGSGPFTFIEAQGGDYIRLAANRNWLNQAAGGPYLDYLRFKVYPSGADQVEALKAGRLHVAEQLPEDMVAPLLQHPDLIGYQWQRNGYGYLAFNNDRFPTSNQAVRQALSHALNRQAIIDGAFAGKATLLLALLPAMSWAHDPGIRGNGYDPEKAQSILVADGWQQNAGGIYEKDGRPLGLTLVVSSGSQLIETIARQAQSDWRRIGVDVRVEMADFNALISRLDSGDFDVSFSGMTFGLDPSDVADLLQSNPVPTPDGWSQGFNKARYRSAAVDRLLAAGRVESDRDKRKEIYRQVEQLVIADAPYLGIYANTYTDMVSRQVQGMIYYPWQGVSPELFRLYLAP